MPTDLDTLVQAKPYLRSIVALAIHLGRQLKPDATPKELSPDACYAMADAFLARLIDDVTELEKAKGDEHIELQRRRAAEPGSPLVGRR